MRGPWHHRRQDKKRIAALEEEVEELREANEIVRALAGAWARNTVSAAAEAPGRSPATLLRFPTRPAADATSGPGTA